MALNHHNVSATGSPAALTPVPFVGPSITVSNDSSTTNVAYISTSSDMSTGDGISLPGKSRITIEVGPGEHELWVTGGGSTTSIIGVLYHTAN